MDFDQAAELSADGLSVGPLGAWTRVRETTIGLLVDLGVKRSSVVLDLGCGHLRIGSWLIPYLEAGNYLGIEPREAAVEAGLATLDPYVVARKRPEFSTRTDFNLDFGRALDFVVARSVWSHATRHQIRATLDSFAACAAPGGVLLASFYPPVLRRRSLWPYYGHDWCYPGQTRRGASAHWPGFLRRECRRRGLTVEFRRIRGVHQVWAIVRVGAS